MVHHLHMVPLSLFLYLKYGEENNDKHKVEYNIYVTVFDARSIKYETYIDVHPFQ